MAYLKDMNTPTYCFQAGYTRVTSGCIQVFSSDVMAREGSEQATALFTFLLFLELSVTRFFVLAKAKQR